MININKFCVYMLIIWILGVSVAIYGERNKSASQEEIKYELKSDIINFDYTEMAYPLQESEIGIKDDAQVPRKLFKGEPEKKESKTTIIINSILEGFLLVFGLMAVCVLMFFFTFLMLLIVLIIKHKKISF